MKTIWKYTLANSNVQALEMPARADILAVQMQRGQLKLWAQIDTTVQKEVIKIHIIGTGANIPEEVNLKYIGTYQSNYLNVFHVFKEVTVLDAVKNFCGVR